MQLRSFFSATGLAQLAIFTLAYLLTGIIGLLIQTGHEGITPIWPPSGIALFAFCRYGPRMWPVVAIGVALLAWYVGLPPVSAAIATAGNITEAWLGYFLIRRFDIEIGQRLQDTVRFLLFPVLLAPVSAATIGTTGMIMGGTAGWGEMPMMWFMWWLGDACGILLFTPLLHAWWRRPTKWSTSKRLIEWLAVISFSMFIGWHTFRINHVAEMQGEGNLQFLVMPFLLWAAIRLGLRGATLVSLIACGWVLWGALNGSGPFATSDHIVAGLFESSFILVVTLTGLVVQALFREHARDIDTIRKAHDQMEERVKERTVELEQANERLRQEIDSKILTQRALRKSEEHLYRAKEAAENANDSKTRFLAAASHDLRQPLQVIMTHSELLAMKNQDPALADPIDQLANANATMQELLEKLLDVSKIDAGRLSTKLTVFSVNTILRELQDQYQQSATEKGIGLKLVPSSVAIYSDPALIRIILQNLISNAIKYTASGRVLIGCRRRGNRLRICVCDTGIGIAAEKQEAIFEDFFQLDNPARDRKKGTGFGLAIVRRVANQLKYPLYVHSVPGKGSCFAIDAPVSGETERASAGRSQAALPESTGTSETILLVDDNEIVLDANRMLLDTLGYHVISVPDPDSAMDALSSGIRETELIISDYRLSGGITGVELIRKLRAESGRNVPAIILTGDITIGNKEDFLPGNCLLVRKPVAAGELNRQIRQQLDHSPG